MIDVDRETLLTPAEAAKAIAHIMRGARPAPSTIWRWTKRGVRGVKLDHLRFGSRVFTSREAIVRFAQQLTERDAQDDEARSAAVPRPRLESQRRRAVAEATRELEAAGI